MLVNANIEHNIRNAGYYGDYAVDNNEVVTALSG